jgi:multicomponent Na+:H+ antiporter subunit C
MESAMAILIGILVAAGIYQMLAKNLVRFVFGLIILGNAVNLLLFTAGRWTHRTPPLIPAGADTLAAPAANALPQALVLTAIVIGFAVLAYVLVLFYRCYAVFGSLDPEAIALQTQPPGDDPSSPATGKGGGA